MRDFLADRTGSRAARYVAAELPTLPFRDGAFDLVLCSHLLFLYSDEIGREAHIDAIREMLRVGREVRVFPLFDLHGRESDHLRPVIEHFEPLVSCELVPVGFEFQRGASTMLRLAPLGPDRR